VRERRAKEAATSLVSLTKGQPDGTHHRSSFHNEPKGKKKRGEQADLGARTETKQERGGGAQRERRRAHSRGGAARY